jgi:hypothetical protein
MIVAALWSKGYYDQFVTTSREKGGHKIGPPTLNTRQNFPKSIAPPGTITCNASAFASDTTCVMATTKNPWCNKPSVPQHILHCTRARNA